MFFKNFSFLLGELWNPEFGSEMVLPKRVMASANNWPGLQGGNSPSLLQFISEMTREEPGVLCNINSYLFMKCLPLENNVGEAGQFLAQRVHTLLQEDDLM